MKQYFILAIGFAVLTSSLRGATYSDRLHGFSLEYNESHWEFAPQKGPMPRQDIDRATRLRTLVVLQSKEADEKYRARFSVVVEDVRHLAGGGVLAYQKHALGFLKSQRFQNIKIDTLKIAGLPKAFEIIADQRDFGLTFRQVGFIIGNEGYLLTAAARISKFESYRKETDALLNSFRFLKGVQ